MLTSMCKLGNGLSQNNLIMESLQAVRLRISQGRAAGNAEHRTTISERCCKPGQTIAKAGPDKQLHDFSVVREPRGPTHYSQ